MFSSLFIKLTLATLGSIGLGTGGYFVYKTFSKKVEETNSTPSLPRQDESNSDTIPSTSVPNSPGHSDNRNQQLQQVGERTNLPGEGASGPGTTIPGNVSGGGISE